MSRTHKDMPWKVKFPESKFDYKYYQSNNNFCFLEYPGKLTKKKRSYKEYHGMPTPMWWISLMMNQPQRSRGKQWEKQVLKTKVSELIDQDYPDVGRKPHIYYW